MAFDYAVAMRIKGALKQVPGYRFNPATKEWSWPATAHNARDLFDRSRLFNPILDAEAQALLDDSSRHDKHTAIKTALNLAPIPGLKTDAWLHQRQAYYFCQPLQAAMLNMAMGTGKTLVACGLFHNIQARNILIVCPKSVMTVWPDQIDRHIGRGYYNIYPLTGRMDARIDTVSAAKWASPNVFIINYEAFAQSGTDSLVQAIVEKCIDFIILDESHRAKSPKGAASKALVKLSKKLPNAKKLCLSGTPLAHSPLDIWAQYAFLDETIFGSSFYAFKNRYTVMEDRYHSVVGYKNMDDLNGRMYRIGFQADKSVIQLPPLVESTRTFELSPKFANEYQTIKHTFLTTMAEIDIPNTITAMLKCQQLCSGFIKNGDEIIQAHSGKIDLLIEVLDEIPESEPIVIFTRFQHEIAMIREKMPDIMELSGQRNELAQWQAGEGRIIVVQIQAGSVGIDLTRAAYAIYYSMDWSLANYEQSKARIHRPGQEKTSQLIYLVANAEGGTIDKDILDALSARQNFIQEITKEKK